MVWFDWIWWAEEVSDERELRGEDCENLRNGGREKKGWREGMGEGENEEDGYSTVLYSGEWGGEGKGVRGEWVLYDIWFRGWSIVSRYCIMWWYHCFERRSSNQFELISQSTSQSHQSIPCNNHLSPKKNSILNDPISPSPFPYNSHQTRFIFIFNSRKKRNRIRKKERNEPNQ